MEQGFNSYSPGMNISDKSKVAALRRQEKQWKSLQGQDPTIETAARGVFPGQTQVNWGGIIGNALGIYNEGTTGEEADTKTSEAQRKSYNRLMEIMNKHDATPEQMSVAASAISPTLGKMTADANKGIAVDLDPETELAIAAAKEQDPTFNETQARATIKNEAVRGSDGKYLDNPTSKAIGSGQIMPTTSAGLNKNNGTNYDPRNNFDNVMQQAQLQKELRDRYPNDMARQVSAYNAGGKAVDASATGVPNNPETQAYVPSVLGGMGVPLEAGGMPLQQVRTTGSTTTTTRNGGSPIGSDYTDAEKMEMGYFGKELGMESQVKALTEEDKLGAYGSLVTSRSGVNLLYSMGKIDEKTKDEMLKGVELDDSTTERNYKLRLLDEAYQRNLAKGVPDAEARRLAAIETQQLSSIGTAANVTFTKEAQDKLDQAQTASARIEQFMTENPNGLTSTDQFASMLESVGGDWGNMLSKMMKTKSGQRLDMLVIADVLKQMKDLGGNDTEKELAYVAKAYGNALNTPETLKAFLNDMRRAAKVGARVASLKVADGQMGKVGDPDGYVAKARAELGYDVDKSKDSKVRTW